MSIRLLFLLIGLGASTPASAAQSAPADTPDHSVAERMVFMNEHLANVQPPATLHYSFRKSGSLEKAFHDKVSLVLARRADGSCCSASGEFLTAERRLTLPDIDDAHANPVILYFLEHDVRDMQRLTKGQQNHFRRRIRMAVFNGAAVRPATWQYRGQPVQGHEVEISPYMDDPSRARFERLAHKRYVFMVSEAVPGGVYGIRSRIDDADASAPPLIVEEMYIDGASAALAGDPGR